jgi:dihydroflavonol-4-reductase
MVLTVAVTGAAGFIAMHIIKLLLIKGYNVNATLRSLKDEDKINELKKALVSEDSKGKLELFEADLLDIGSFKNCFENCSVVLHTASPFQIFVKNPEKDLVEPAVKGTENVITECLKNSNIKRVIVTSSMIAICEPKEESFKYDEKNWNNPLSSQLYLTK